MMNEQFAASPGDPRWSALAARDRAADGTFVYAVRTTGVYCRPSCAARPARPQNVRFFATGQEAEAAGFRPCKRCRPDSQDGGNAALVAAVCRWIDTLEEPPGLEEIAAQAGLSPFHFHRVFKQVTGLTPRQYVAGRRADRMRSTLATARSVTDAVYEAGYQSNGTFYGESNDALGMTPSAYRAGGEKEEIRYTTRVCSLGIILVAHTGRGVCAILLGDSPGVLAADLRARFPKASLLPAASDFEGELARVIAMVEAPAGGTDLPLDIRGTAFQRRVWQALREIPAGSTASYSEVAARIGSPGSARAVAQACAANSLAVAIPCHRVVREDGGLSGYRWGLERKRTLLERESR